MNVSFILLAKWLLRSMVCILGPQKRKLPLHAGVYYVKSEEKPKIFCTISDDLDHVPEAIREHLKRILPLIREKHQTGDCLLIFSGGPRSQYGQNGNFYPLSNKPFDFGYKRVKWNFMRLDMVRAHLMLAVEP